MAHFLTFAEASSPDLMKFVIIGIIIFIALIGQVLKFFGFDDSEQNDSQNPKQKNPRPKTYSSNEDMENAKRRLQEMIKERQGKSLRPDFPKAPKPTLYELEPEVVAKPKAPTPKPVEIAPSAPVFDYNTELEIAEKLMQESMISKHSHAETTPLEPISAKEIKDAEISDLIHDKKFLKKSIVISEILDKPISLR